MKTNQMKLMKLNKFLILLFLTNLSFAQHNTTAKIKKVAIDGLHKIVLPPAIRSFSKEDLSDFRICDATGNEVPYFIIQSEKETLSNTFEEYTILSKTVVPQKTSSIIISHPSVTNSNRISLSIANSDVVKTYSISGSDDQKEWFGLSNAQELDDLNSPDKTTVIKTIFFPLNSYRFLKIDFDDKKTLPINILKAGNFHSPFEKHLLQQIIPKSSSITQLPNEKKTQIHLVFEGPQVINQIVFDIKKPALYKRNAGLYKNVTRKIKHKTATYQENSINFELSSDTKNTFNISQIFEKELFITIDNQDNQPLTISEIKCNQISVSIIADLKKNEQYTIKTGNPNLSTPRYDLSYFKNNIATTLPETAIYGIEQTVPNQNGIQKKSFWQQSSFMWFCIAFAGIVILYFTASLVKEIRRNN